MIVRRKGGLTEFIPTPREKREGLIRDHILKLVGNLHQRILRLEREDVLSAEQAETFASLFKRIKADENWNQQQHTSFATVLGLQATPQYPVNIVAISCLQKNEARSCPGSKGKIPNLKG